MIKINSNYHQLEALEDYNEREEHNPNYYRISGELRFLCAYSNSLSGKYDPLITNTSKTLAGDIAEAGYTSAGAVEKAEKALEPLAAEAKSFEFYCVAHAHIDMNWMWGYNETVSATLGTIETILDLMEEFPEFTFSQSQASVYKIVERFSAPMLEEIKKRVKEGRWEVTASTWVETDKNMPSGESLSRHILYTKKYFAQQFGINPADLVIDFEPDSFGHSLNVPEICNSGAVKYYYHCRGQVGDKIVYRWRSPSSAELLVYTEPFWYNSDVDNTIAEYAPELSRITLNKTLLKVYGVGNHGGGPTRRDIKRFIEMNSWPLYPKFTFGKLKSYFETIEKSRNKYTVLDDEINFLCDGCYTTQSRIKAGNRKSECLLADAEFYATSAMSWAMRSYPGELLASAWRKVLFNQFHDIIPGSGVTETREYASGLYQEVFAAAESARTLALEAVASRIKRRGISAEELKDTDDSRGQGAGVGYGQTGRGTGLRRIYHIFNSLPYDREETVSITVWDYEGDISQTGIEDHEGKTLPVQLGESGNYWGHRFNTLITKVSVPSCGYTTLILDRKPDYEIRTGFINDMRIQTPDSFVLENELVRAVLDPFDGSIASFVDKKTGTDLASPEGFGVFRLALEAHHKNITGWQRNMSAWFTGRFKIIEDINHEVEIKPHAQGNLRNAWNVTFNFGSASSLEAVISLDAGSRMLRYDLNVNWREFGSKRGIPNLHFYLPLSWKPAFLFDVPFGMKERKAVDMDLPAESFVLAGHPGRSAAKGKKADEEEAGKNKGKVSLGLFSMDKYAFRCLEDSLSLTLIRGSINPDPTPETGWHHISFALAPIGEQETNEDLARESLVYRRGLTVISGKNKPGKTEDLEPCASFLKLKGGVLSAVKRSEPGTGTAGILEGKKIVLRIYEVEGKETKAELSLAYPAISAFLSDVLEEKQVESCLISKEGKLVSFKLPAFSAQTLVVEFK